MVLLDVQNVKTYFPTEKGIVKAVDGVSFKLGKGEALGLAGESGCGKTTAAYSIMKLVPAPGKIVNGHVYFNGKDLITLNEKSMRKIRWKKISMVFQQAMNALNPTIKVGEQIAEAIMLHENISEEDAMKGTERLFDQVGLGRERIKNYPFEFSGGMRQRAMIAMSLSCNPELIITDEPTTALDVTVQAQILELIKSLQRTLNMSLLLITHDLSVIAETCDKVAIMYAGKVVEKARVESLYKNPIHPYTKGLMEAIPSIERGKSRTLFSIPGQTPDLINPPPSCRFHPRCPYAKDICRREEPKETEINGAFVACHFSYEMKNISSTDLWSL